MLRSSIRSALTLAIAVAATASFAVPAFAQGLELPDLSPRAEVMQTAGITAIRVNYASPGVKGRKIFGELVPFGQLWRTGANSATTLEVSTDVTIGGQKVPAGKYALFTIPGKDKWTVIVNKNPNQGGTRSYDQKLDQARFEVEPGKTPTKMERLTFIFADTQDDGTGLVMMWDDVQVVMPISIDTAGLVEKGIEGYAKGSARSLANAARHYKRVKQLDRALAMVDDALAIDETWFALWVKADILAEKGDIKAAYPIAEKAYALGQKDDYFFWKDLIAKKLEEWKSKK